MNSDNYDDWVVFSSLDSTASDHEGDGARDDDSLAEDTTTAAEATTLLLLALYVLPVLPGEVSVSTLSQSASGSPHVVSQIQYFESLGHGGGDAGDPSNDTTNDAINDTTNNTNSETANETTNETTGETTDETADNRNNSFEMVRASLSAGKLVVVLDLEPETESEKDDIDSSRPRRPRRQSRWFYLVTAYDDIVLFTMVAAAVVVAAAVAMTMVLVPLIQHHWCPLPPETRWHKVGQIIDDVIYEPQPTRTVWDAVRLGPPPKVKRVDKWVDHFKHVDWHRVLDNAQRQSQRLVSSVHHRTTGNFNRWHHWIKGQWQVYRDEELPAAKVKLEHVVSKHVVPAKVKLGQLDHQVHHRLHQCGDVITKVLANSKVGATKVVNRVAGQFREWESQRAEARVWMTYQAHRILTGWKRRRAALNGVGSPWPAATATWIQLKFETHRGVRAAISWLERTVGAT